MADPWPPAPDLAQDFHVHSTFSDGRGTIAENVAAARAVGLRTLCLVDHVRADTDWLGDFLVATAELIETDRASHDTALEIRRGVETKVLDTAGRLDLPDGTGPLDHVLVADHQFPLDDGPHTPKEILAGRRSGRWGDAELAAALLDAMAAAVPQVAGRGILAHLFSVLPKAGLSEAHLPPAGLDDLARTCARHRVAVEANERWRCPTGPTLARFVAAGVPLVCATDSHRTETIGRYDVVRRNLAEAEALA